MFDDPPLPEIAEEQCDLLIAITVRYPDRIHGVPDRAAGPSLATNKINNVRVKREYLSKE